MEPGDALDRVARELHDLVAIPSPSGGEHDAVERLLIDAPRWLS
ncbi:MAG: hypothetical protein WD096_00430 [Actinomycetota bacterium]